MARLSRRMALLPIGTFSAPSRCRPMWCCPGPGGNPGRRPGLVLLPVSVMIETIPDLTFPQVGSEIKAEPHMNEW
jgi:hypothetical protein